MKTLGRAFFRLIAGWVRQRYHPTVIGVAGSVGKTATKDAIATVLDDGQGSTRRTTGSFNAEIGVPVTIISGGAARGTIGGWIRVIAQGIYLLVRHRPYPKFLVLELGSDKPGDLEPLIRLAKPQLGVLTAIAPEHMEFFGSMDAVAKEESSVISTLPADGVAIVNADDQRVQGVTTAARTIRYGWSAAAQVRAAEMEILRNDQGRPTGIRISTEVDGGVLKNEIQGVIGRHQAYPILAAIAVGQALGIDGAVLTQRLQRYQPPAGRMRLFEGHDESVIIDDSYNASPEAMVAAVKALAELEIRGRRYAIFGQMSELGATAVHWHEHVGQAVATAKLDGMMTIGPLAERIGLAAVQAGLAKNRIDNVTTPEAAAIQLRSQLQAGDAVLIKGSRYPKPGYAGHLERAVEMLLAHPERDREQLVR